MTDRIRSRGKLFMTLDVRTAFEVCQRGNFPILASDRGYYPNSKNSELETPIGSFEALEKELQFTLDVCTTKENAKGDGFWAVKHECGVL